MDFKSFRFQCALRVVALACSLGVAAYILLHTALYATFALILILAVFQTVSLIRYIETTNRQLTRFLQSIEYADLSQTFTGKAPGASFGDLYRAFTRVTGAFRKLRAEREEQYRYLQTVVQHIGVGVMVFRADGTVELINNTARRLLYAGEGHAGAIRHLSALPDDYQSLRDALLDMKAGDRALVRVGETQLSLHATEFGLREGRLKLVSIQNIQSELEEKEMESWQNLIRVLTHEIMNSVTPIASLASTAHDLATEERITSQDILQEEMMNDIRAALQTIETRSRGLLRFVESFRTLTRIPPPEFQRIGAQTLFSRVEQLMKPRLEEESITLNIQVSPEILEIVCDPELIEQALINLVTNAIQALADRPDPRITLTGLRNDQGRVALQIADNGPGILPEAMEKIFIPFFTTRQDGSGIGLSLSRQIMRLHHGTITAYSEPDVSTVFTLRF